METLRLAWVVLAARAAEPLAGLGALASWAREGGLLLAVALVLLAVALQVLAARKDQVAGAAAGLLVGALSARAASSGVAQHFSTFGENGLLIACAGGLALLGGLWPRLGAFAVGALPGALLGAAVGHGDGELPAMILGALVLGIVAALAQRVARATAISALAATALLGAGLALAGKARWTGELIDRPMTLVAGIMVLTIAGAAWRLGLRAPARPALAPSADEEEEDDDEA